MAEVTKAFSGAAMRSAVKSNAIIMGSTAGVLVATGASSQEVTDSLVPGLGQFRSGNICDGIGEVAGMAAAAGAGTAGALVSGPFAPVVGIASAITAEAAVTPTVAAVCKRVGAIFRRD